MTKKSGGIFPWDSVEDLPEDKAQRVDVSLVKQNIILQVKDNLWMR